MGIIEYEVIDNSKYSIDLVLLMFVPYPNAIIKPRLK